MIDTFCKETVLYFPTNLRGNYSPEEAWGMPAKGCGDYSRRKPGEAREGLRRLLLEKAGGSGRKSTTYCPKTIAAKASNNCQRPPTQSFTRPLDGWFPAAPLPTAKP